MACAFGAWNRTKKTLWFILRSSDNTGVILEVPVGKHKMVRMDFGEIVSSNIFEDEAEAIASIGAGEMGNFQRMVAQH